MLEQMHLIERLTIERIPVADLRRDLNRFAHELGWHPSAQVEPFTTARFANAHLLVEHGLENSAVISFLRRPFSQLGFGEKQELLGLSYNNLVDWHVAVELTEVSFVFNRGEPFEVVESLRLTDRTYDRLRVEAFEEIVGRRPSPNVPALDDALIGTISHWKRLLAADAEASIENQHLSALFNAIIFARAVEDFARWHQPANGTDPSRTELLLERLSEAPEEPISDLLVGTVRQLTREDPPRFVLDPGALAPFAGMDPSTKNQLLQDFYRNRYESFYGYDFAVMSNHALSRIYEHYVSVLHFPSTEQISFIPPIPEEQFKRSSGSVYTPQFVANFFTRFLRENLPPNRFRSLKPIDPSCGSGIFLRSLLEAQCDPFQEFVTDQEVRGAFGSVVGVDLDPNAVHACRLSLALLHMVLTNGHFPTELSVLEREAFDWFSGEPELESLFDVVMTNPPFVALENQPTQLRQRIQEFLGDRAFGRIDTYAAFLVLAFRLLKPGGFGLFVVPHSFLISESASPIRKLLGESCHIHFIADLSGVRVFENVDAYVILLVFEKRSEHTVEGPAVVVRAQEMVGQALQDALSGKRKDGPYYSIYDVDQSTLGPGPWTLRTLGETSVSRRASELPTLGDLFTVRLGFISGADDVFIVPASSLPKGERNAFVPYLADREIGAFRVPSRTSRFFFYPYIDEELLTEVELRERFPGTYEYLRSQKRVLSDRAAVKKGDIPWWRPERPRLPQNLMRPKLITPHLVVVPRFALDEKGRFAVSRSPLLYPTESGAELDLMRFYLGILNSTACFWHISRTSHRYSHGYSMLEPKTLKRVPVPDINALEPLLVRSVLGAVGGILNRAGDHIAADLEKTLDQLSAEAYGLTREERRVVGMRTG